MDPGVLSIHAEGQGAEGHVALASAKRGHAVGLDGAPAVTLRYDEANGYWAAVRA
jgi:hypothetical protein